MAHDLSRRALLRRAGTLTVAVPMAGWLAACSRVETGGDGDGEESVSTLDRAREQGYLRVAIANEPPYTRVEADGTVTGVEPDVLRAVVQNMGIDEIEGVIAGYDSMIPGLQANRWDVIAAGLFMKESRCAEVLYSEPDIVSTESFAVLPGNPEGIVSVASILENPDIKVAALGGAFEEGILLDAEVPESQLVDVSDGHSGIEAVKSGRADAFFLPTLSLNSLAEDVDGFEVTPAVEDAPKTGAGAAFRKADTTLHEEYNRALAEFKETPEFAETLANWGFDAAAVEGVTTEELCQTPG